MIQGIRADVIIIDDIKDARTVKETIAVNRELIELLRIRSEQINELPRKLALGSHECQVYIELVSKSSWLMRRAADELERVNKENTS